MSLSEYRIDGAEERKGELVRRLFVENRALKTRIRDIMAKKISEWPEDLPTKWWDEFDAEIAVKNREIAHLKGKLMNVWEDLREAVLELDLKEICGDEFKNRRIDSEQGV